MGLRLVEVFRSVIRDLATGQGSVLIEPMDMQGGAAAREPDDAAPPAVHLDMVAAGLVPA